MSAADDGCPACHIVLISHAAEATVLLHVAVNGKIARFVLLDGAQPGGPVSRRDRLGALGTPLTLKA